jgi:hypothetical protein
VLEHPADADCARLLGFENILSPKLASRLLGRATRHPLAVRAADCRLDPHGSTGTLERILPFGTVTRAIVTVDGTRILIDSPASPPKWFTAVQPGSHVDVEIDVSAARALP